MIHRALSKGARIWWMADRSTGLFYGLPLDQPSSPVLTPSPTRLSRLPKPDMIVLSKGDIYDPEGKTVRYAAEHGLVQTHALHAFRIFETR